MNRTQLTAANRPAPDSCYHEAGHCAAFWHYGIPIDYVDMNPDPLTGHRAHTKLAESRTPPEGEGLDAEMRCAAAGEIAQRRYLDLEPLTEGQLRTRFRLYEPWARENIDAESAPSDETNFALAAVLRDMELEAADPDATTGLPRWLKVWHEAESLVSDLWPAVEGIAAELMSAGSKVLGGRIEAIAAAAVGKAA